MNQILYSRKAADIAKVIAVIFCILFILLIVVSVSFGIANKYNEKILKGVFVDGIYVGELTKEEATQKIEDTHKQLLDNNIILKMNTYEKRVSGEDLGINFASKLVDAAYNYGRTGNLLSDNYVVLFSYFNNENKIEMGLTLDNSKYEGVLNSIISEVDAVEKDDEYVIEDGKILLSKGKDGYRIDKKGLEDSILAGIFENNTTVEIPTQMSEAVRIDLDKIYNEVYVEPVDASYSNENGKFEVIKEVDGLSFDVATAKVDYLALADGETMTIDLITRKPAKTTESLNDILFKDVLATFTTKYDTGYTSRVNNLKIAAKNINGTILYPNEEFSYNKVVGPRTVANGFKEAHVFAGGEVVDGLGGGICQVSTTLYNSVLLSNLEVTERKAHMMHTGYTKPGLDATVVYGSIDFRFKNNRLTPIKLETTVNGGIVTATIYGLKQADDPIIEVQSVTLKTIPWTTVTREDSTMNKGTSKVVQNPLNGYVSETYKIVKDASGQEISKTLISKDTYKQTSKIVKVGTKEVAVTPPPVVEPTPPPEPVTPVTPPSPENPGDDSQLPPGWDNPESPYA